MGKLSPKRGKVADYIIIRDGKATVTGPAGGAYGKSWNFAVPENFDFKSRSILTFHMERIRDAKNLVFTISVNNKTVCWRGVGSRHSS